MKWRVCKTVTEYHYFVVDAESEQEAMDIVNDNPDLYYCTYELDNRHNSDPGDIMRRVVNAVEVTA
jgi:hypothetical protein